MNKRFLFLFVVLAGTIGLAGCEKKVLEFELQPKINNILWTLQVFEKRNADILIPSDFIIQEGREAYTITFHDDMTVTGTASTNRYSSTYEISDTGWLRISKYIRTTGVNEPKEGIGDDFRVGLRKAHSYERRGNVLRVYYGDKRRVMIFLTEGE
jgi:hypothetical protein